MTISSAYTPTIYTGNGVTTAFPTVFPFATADDLVVSIIRLSDNSEGLLFKDINYTVSGAGSPSGGTVTTVNFTPTVFAPAYPAHPMTSAYQLKIKRRTAQTQPLDLVANDGAPAEAQELAYDRLTMMVQELGQTITDIVLAPGGVLMTNGILPPQPAAYTLFPWYSGVFGGYHKFRQLMVGPSFRLAVIDDNYAWMQETGFLDPTYMGGGADPVTGRGTSVLQLKPVGWGDPAIAIWQGDAAANTGKWGIGPTLDGQFSIGALSDDMSVWNDHVRFLRSTTTATSVQMQTVFDANGKRVGNVGSFDFDESAKGTTSGAVTFDFTQFQSYSITLNGNSTWTLTPPAGVATTYIECTQDGTGSRVVTLPAACKFTAATAAADKLASTGANKRDLYVFKWNAAGTACLTQIFKDW